MEIDHAHFRQQLLPILRSISNACIVTFDLEMSGITTRPKFSAGDRSLNVGKLILQEQYEEMKSAAETYQVLQIGLTCVSKDQEKGFYLAQPYNFNLSPLAADGVELNLSRNFTFAASASGFLLKNGFDFGKVFKEGVTYLSRDEEINLLEDYKERANHNAKIPDMIVAPDAHDTLEFLRLARKTVSGWVKEANPEFTFVNVASPSGPLNGYQRRLVHQLIRNEFPGLRTFARNDGSFMQVEKLNLERELAYQKSRETAFLGKIARQTGMRWIFEALSGGDLSGIDPDWFCKGLGLKEINAVKEEFKEICEKLKNNKKRILVGHNLFTDLGFLYKTFIGTLPTSVKHFQEEIHDLFPFVIDTKYLATHGAKDMSPRSNLKELLTPFRKVHTPLILLHQEHTSYGSEIGRDHEAGFDSWMTAELFIKLAAKLYAEVKDTLDGSDSSGPEAREGFLNEHQESDGGVELKKVTSDEDLISFTDNQPPEWHAMELAGPSTAVDEGAVKVPQWLPQMTSSFWDIYVNKLRVNASEGGVCDLAERNEDRIVEDVRRKLGHL
ncbi:related to poly(A)-specific ribonuclease [Phialocephala subalpina]|uniref:Poly(A)-specific ribonuclease PARN n=1 Tax=Phialocephala subalpina TaxID=576137 RepID=A0A1L7XPB3_9HELO|nr:related to poly(A)-specific ribonuclease [Phialocephala subalpina]